MLAQKNVIAMIVYGGQITVNFMDEMETHPDHISREVLSALYR